MTDKTTDNTISIATGAVGPDLAGRFLAAIADGSLPGFIDAEARAGGCRTQIGTIAASRSVMPDLPGTAIKLFALARLTEAQADLAVNGPLLREGARLAAVTVALRPNNPDTRRQKQVLLEALRHDGLEARASLLIQLIEASLAVPDGMMAMAVQGPPDEGPSAFVGRMMRQASTAHRLMIEGDETAARMIAQQVVAAILAFNTDTAETEEMLSHRRRLRAVASTLFAARLLAPTNALAMLDAAATCDSARVECLDADGSAACRRFAVH